MSAAPGQLRTGCNWGLPDGRCGRSGHLYPVGIRCDDHKPNHHLKPKKPKQEAQ